MEILCFGIGILIGLILGGLLGYLMADKIKTEKQIEFEEAEKKEEAKLRRQYENFVNDDGTERGQISIEE